MSNTELDSAGKPLVWIKHDGGPMPVPGDTAVAIAKADGYRETANDAGGSMGTAAFWDDGVSDWTKSGPNRIIEYAIVTPSPSVASAASAADTVSAPSHYTQGGIECIDAIRAALTPDEFRGYCKGNMLKYAWRERHKNGDEDLRKAAVYAAFATDLPNG